MYSSIIKIILFTMVLYKTTEAVVGLLPKDDRPLNLLGLPGCYLATLKHQLEVGIPYSPQDGNSCEQYLCNSNGVTKHLTCPFKEVSEGCEEIEGDKYLPYPECCNIVRCTDEYGYITDF